MDGAITNIVGSTTVTILFDQNLNWYILDGDRLRIYGNQRDLQTTPAVNLISRCTGLSPDTVGQSVSAIFGRHGKFHREMSNLLQLDDPRIKILEDQLTDERRFSSVYRQDLEANLVKEMSMSIADEILNRMSGSHERRGTIREQQDFLVQQDRVMGEIARLKKSRFMAITLERGDEDGTEKET